jgi:ribosome-associated heat shock protein Hsp15
MSANTPPATKVRLDKWLQVARVFKTRSRATRACQLGRVRVNGQPAKPHRPVALDDRVEVELREWTRVLVVRELRDRPLPKAEAARLFEDLSPPRPLLDPLSRLLRRTPAKRERGAGRPTKRERRRIERWRRD